MEQTAFDIIDYISGLTPFVFDKSVYQTIAQERGLSDVSDFSDLSEQDTDLLRADVLFMAYCGPSKIGSFSHQHGSYQESFGDQSIYSTDRERMLSIICSLYRKWDDPKLQIVEGIDGTISVAPLF